MDLLAEEASFGSPRRHEGSWSSSKSEMEQIITIKRASDSLSGEDF